jgi:thiol-disulfide isomerase/thioredoxin
MKFQFRRGQLPGLFAAVVLVIVASVMAFAADEEKSQEKSPEKPSDVFAVPEGTPDELLAYIERVKAAKPDVQALEAVKDFRAKQSRAIATAADKILAAKPTPEQLEAAVGAKVMALTAMMQLGDKEAAAKLEALPAELKKAGHAKMARDVQAFVLQRRLMEARGADAKTITELAKSIEAFLQEGPLDPGCIQLAYAATQVAELSGDNKLAASVYQEMGTILAKSDDTRIADLGEKLQGAARRMELVGKPLELEGVTSGGEPLKWSDYRGKVTLVVFWATWCGPCREEIGHLREYYKDYHDRGFEVVAVSVDEDREALKEFLAKSEIPWTVVVDQAREDDSKGQPMGTRYGIIGIPEAFLVDRAGKVVSTEVRGPQLGKLLTEMIGPKPKETGEASGDAGEPEKPAAG